MTFQTRRIGEICQVKGGKRLPLGHELIDEITEHPYIRARDIKDGKIIQDDLQFLTNETHFLIKRYIVSKDDICITIVGANVGDVGIVPSSLIGANLTENAVKLTSFSSECDPIYLALLLSQSSYKYIMQLMAGGAAQPKLGIYKVEELKVQLPSLPLQRQIAAVLGRYDALLENYQTQVATLEGLAQELYQEWFVRGRCPGAAAGPNGELPAGWEAIELSTISAVIQRGITPSYDDEGEILCLNQRCIREKKIDYATGRLQVKNPGKKVIQFGDVLINSTGEGTLGRTAQVYNLLEEPTTVDTHVTIARPLPEIPVEYYGYVVTEQEEYFVSMALGATGQTELSREAIGQAKVVLPTAEAMQRFSQLVNSMKKKAIVLLDQMVTLRATRDALLPRLLSGQLLPAPIPPTA
ncbi:restriction endonuclease subunit S [Hymenobacter lapidiphilus]|uniref:Restriction endonuclease subunit S n=1 Tax=Hymenobacter lapidiphilus TaxID=2608003 RepID=A0A7Y7PL26_9BACT|nr:restriction endonuclease subunit S [Hymenobacter lapidiphilus]NVO29710.1 restriction endonuclease subunit S [Hymenobacter lapidiphilus]